MVLAAGPAATPLVSGPVSARHGDNPGSHTLWPRRQRAVAGLGAAAWLLGLLATSAGVVPATAAPPRQLPVGGLPELPRAHLSSISPTFGPVLTPNYTVTFTGTGFTEEYGVGSLRCRWTYDDGERIITCARRVLGECVPTAGDQETCTTTTLECDAPEKPLAQRVQVQVTNDYGFTLHENRPDNASHPHVHEPHPERWSLEPVFYTYVPHVTALEGTTTGYVAQTPHFDTYNPAGANAGTETMDHVGDITVRGSGFDSIGQRGRALSCVFQDAGPGDVYPPAHSFAEAVAAGETSTLHRWQRTEAVVQSPEEVTCPVPYSLVAKTFRVSVSPDFTADTLTLGDAACNATDPCNHVSPFSLAARFTYLPIVTHISPEQGPLVSATPVAVHGMGFVRNHIQVLATTAPDDARIDGTFRLRWPGLGLRNSTHEVQEGASPWTAALPSNASADSVADALSGLGLGNVTVVRSAPDLQRGYNWTVFLHDLENSTHAVPLLEVDGAALTPATEASGHGVTARVSSQLRCRFGDYTVEPFWFSFDELRCEVPPLLTTLQPHPVNMSMDAGRHFSHTHHIHGLRHMYVVPTVQHVTPSEANLRGRLNVTVHGSGFADVPGFRVKFNETVVARADTHVHSSTEASVITPPAPEEPVETDERMTAVVEVSVDTVHYSNRTHATQLGRLPSFNDFNYYVLPVLDSVFPPFGPQVGGTLLRVYGRHFVDWAPMQCHFARAGTVNFARGSRAAQSSVLVNASDAMHVGMWPFTFRARGPEAAVDGSTNGFGSEYNAVTELEAEPWWQVDLGANRTLDQIRVFTRSDDPHYEPVPFWIILSDEVSFEDASLEVALGRAMAAALVTEDEAMDVSAVASALSVTEDRIVAGAGDHSFTWSGLGGVPARHLRVQMHPTGATRQLAVAEVQALSVGRSSAGVFVDALFHNTSMVTCVTPGLQGETLTGNTPVNVSIAYANKRDLDRSDPLHFLYHPDVHVSRLSLDRAHNDAQLPVLIHGTGFQNTTSTNFDYQRYAGGPGARPMPYGDRNLLKCRFGKRSVFATYVNETAVKCVAPPRRQDITVDVEVTLNGIDFTLEHTKFWYYGECKPGYYCPDFETAERSALLVPCPRGSYCPGSGNHEPTPCPPGTFQEAEAEVQCAPCPVGYECPFYGMPAPALCRLGYVCATEGISWSRHPCPPGYYCMRGTKTPATCQHLSEKNEDYPYGFNVEHPRTADEEENTCTRDGTFERVQGLVEAGYRWVGGDDDAATTEGTVDDFLALNITVHPNLCPNGKYCAAGTLTNVTRLCADGEAFPDCYNTPHDCFVGYICREGSETPRGTGECPESYFCPGIPCATYLADTYKPEENDGAGYSYPATIEDFYAAEIAQRQCPCPQGAACQGTGLTAPKDCVPGTFTTSFRQLECTDCPLGFTCPEIAQIDPAVCTPGFMCDEEGLGTETTECIAGHYCGAGVKTGTGFLLEPVQIAGGVSTDTTYTSPDGTVTVTASVPRAPPSFSQVSHDVVGRGTVTTTLDVYFNATNMFALNNLFDGHRDDQHIRLIEGSHVDSFQRRYTGYSNPERYWRGATDASNNATQQLVIDLDPPRRLDRVRVYPVEDSSAEGPMSVRFAVRVTRGGVELDASGGFVEHTRDTSAEYRDVIVANSIDYVDEMAVSNPFAFPTTGVVNTTEAVLSDDEYWLSIPWHEGLLQRPIYQRALPTADEQEAAPQWHSAALSNVSRVVVEMEPLHRDGFAFSALDAVELYTRLETGERPYPCGSRLYCLTGVKTPTMIENAFETPQPCPAGAYCVRATDAPEGSSLCPDGNFCEKGSANPRRVAEGQFAGGEGNAKATQCFPGRYAARPGLGDCIPCPSGFFCPQSDPPLCWNPSRGFFTRHSGKTCADLHVRDIRIQGTKVGEAVSLDAARNDTIICTPGSVCKDPDRASVGARCPAGYYCPEGTLSSSTDTEPTCTADTHCANAVAEGEQMATPMPVTAWDDASFSVEVVESVPGYDTASRPEQYDYYTGYDGALPDTNEFIQPLGDGAPPTEGKPPLRGSIPHICSPGLKRDVDRVGRYPGCYVYDGIILKGVGDVKFGFTVDVDVRKQLGPMPTDNPSGAAALHRRIKEAVLTWMRRMARNVWKVAEPDRVWMEDDGDVRVEFGRELEPFFQFNASLPIFQRVLDQLTLGNAIGSRTEYLVDQDIPIHKEEGYSFPRSLAMSGFEVYYPPPPLPEVHEDIWMWRGVVDAGGRPSRVQQSRLTVNETCTQRPTSERCLSSPSLQCDVKTCNFLFVGGDSGITGNAGGEFYNGMWRSVDNVPSVRLTMEGPLAATIATSASEGMSIYGHFALWWQPPASEVLTRLVPYDATGATVASMLNETFGVLATVTRSEPGLQQDYTWSIAFESAPPYTLHASNEFKLIHVQAPATPGRGWERAWGWERGKGSKQCLFTLPEPLAPRELSKEVADGMPYLWVSDGLEWQQFVLGGEDGKKAENEPWVYGGATRAVLSIDLPEPAGMDAVRVHPYVPVGDGEYASCDYRVSVVDEAGNEVLITGDFDLSDAGAAGVVRTARDVPVDVRAELWFFEHGVPPVPAGDPIYVNDTWWQDNTPRKVSRIKVEMWAPTVEGKPVHKVFVHEVVPLLREKQYKPGAIVLAQLAKEERAMGENNTLGCCMRPIPCEPGGYCLGGIAHPYTITSKITEAYDGWSDSVAPLEGVQGAYFGEASSNPNGDGLCPEGYFCPSGTRIPYPCFRGSSCRGTGNTYPATCNTATFSRVGVPPYQYGWEELWGDTPDPEVTKIYTERRFWNADFRFMTNFPTGDWLEVQGNDGNKQFAGGKRLVLLENGVRQDVNYTATALAHGARMAALQDYGAALPAAKDTETSLALSVEEEDEVRLSGLAEPTHNASTGWSFELWVRVERNTQGKQQVIARSADFDRAARRGWALLLTPYREEEVVSCRAGMGSNISLAVRTADGERYATEYMPANERVPGDGVGGAVDATTLSDKLTALPVAKNLKGAGILAKRDGSATDDDRICNIPTLEGGQCRGEASPLHVVLAEPRKVTSRCEALGECRGRLRSLDGLITSVRDRIKDYVLNWDLLQAHDRPTVEVETDQLAEPYEVVQSPAFKDRFEFYLGNGSHWNILVGTYPPPDNVWTGIQDQNLRRWTHIALTYDGRRMAMYVDGENKVDADYSGPDTALEKEASYEPHAAESDVILGSGGISYEDRIVHNLTFARKAVATTCPGTPDGPVDCYMLTSFEEQEGIDCRPFHFTVDKVATYGYALPRERVRNHYYGVFDVTVGMSECTPCPGGHQCPDEGMELPEECPEGSYRNQVDSSNVECVACVEGTYSRSPGMDHFSRCQLCPPGLVCALEGLSNLTWCGADDESCGTRRCPEGRVCGWGTKRTNMLDVSCPAGYYCFEGTRPNGYNMSHPKFTVEGVVAESEASPGVQSEGLLGSTSTFFSSLASSKGLRSFDLDGIFYGEQAYSKCPAGFFCNDGTGASERDKDQCPEGSYCPLGTAIQCCGLNCEPIFFPGGSYPDLCPANRHPGAPLNETYKWSRFFIQPTVYNVECPASTTSPRGSSELLACRVNWTTVEKSGPKVVAFPILRDDPQGFEWPAPAGNGSGASQQGGIPPVGDGEPTATSRRLLNDAKAGAGDGARGSSSNDSRAEWGAQPSMRRPWPHGGLQRPATREEEPGGQDSSRPPNGASRFSRWGRRRLLQAGGGGGGAGSSHLTPFERKLGPDEREALEGEKFDSGQGVVPLDAGGENTALKAEDIDSPFVVLSLDATASRPLPAMSATRVSFDMSRLDPEVEYNNHFRLSFFLDSNTRAHRVLLPDPFVKNMAGLGTHTASISASATAGPRVQVVVLEAGNGRYLAGDWALAYTGPDGAVAETQRMPWNAGPEVVAEVAAEAFESLLGAPQVEQETNERGEEGSGSKYTLRFPEPGQVGAPASPAPLNATYPLQLVDNLGSGPTTHEFEVFTRQRTRMWVVVDFMQDNLPERLKRNFTFLDQLNSSLTVTTMLPRRAERGKSSTFMAVVFREKIPNSLLPTNMMTNNTHAECPCTLLTGTCAAQYRLTCELPVTGTYINYLMPEDRFAPTRDTFNVYVGADEIDQFWNDPSVQQSSSASASEALAALAEVKTLKKTVTFSNRPSIADQPNKQLQFERHKNFIPTPHLPYVGNCRGFGRNMLLFRLFEDERCHLAGDGEDRVTYVSPLPNLPPVDYSFPPGPDQQQVTADMCDYEVQCVHDEFEEENASPFVARVTDSKNFYWFEHMSELTDVLFYLTFEPMEPEELDDGGQYPGERNFADWIYKKEMVPVTATRDGDDLGVDRKHVPRKVELEVGYWQRNPIRKHIVYAHFHFSEFYRPDFCGGTTASQYYEQCSCGVAERDFEFTNEQRELCTLEDKQTYDFRLKYRPFGYFELLDILVFPTYVYAIVFLGATIGLIAAMALMSWVTKFFTSRRDPVGYRCLKCGELPNAGAASLRVRSPVCHNDCFRMRMKQYTMRITVPAAVGFFLHVLPLLLVVVTVYILLDDRALALLDNFPGSIGSLGSCFPPITAVDSDQCRFILGDDDDKATVRSTRYAMSLLVLGIYMVVRGVTFIVPAAPTDAFEAWKERNRERLSLVGKTKEEQQDIKLEIAQTKAELVEGGGKLDVWGHRFAKRSHMVFTAVMEMILMTCVAQLSLVPYFRSNLIYLLLILKMLKMPFEYRITWDLRELLHSGPYMVAYHVTEIIVCFHAKGLNAFIVAYMFQVLWEYFKRLALDPVVYSLRRKRMVAEGKPAPPPELAMKEDVIRDLAANSWQYLAHLYAPGLIVFFILFREEIQLTANTGIRESDLQLYLIFGMLITFAMSLTDVFANYILERVHHRRHRLAYLYASAPNSHLFTEINEAKQDVDLTGPLRSLDQLGFTSQYYMVTVFLASGIVFLYYAVNIAVRSLTSSVSDLMVYVLVGLSIALCKVSERVVGTVVAKLSTKKKLDLHASALVASHHEIIAAVRNLIDDVREYQWSATAFLERFETLVNDQLMLRKSEFRDMRNALLTEDAELPSRRRQREKNSEVAKRRAKMAKERKKKDGDVLPPHLRAALAAASVDSVPRILLPSKRPTALVLYSDTQRCTPIDQTTGWPPVELHPLLVRRMASQHSGDGDGADGGGGGGGGGGEQFWKDGPRRDAGDGQPEKRSASTAFRGAVRAISSLGGRKARHTQVQRAAQDARHGVASAPVREGAAAGASTGTGMQGPRRQNPVFASAVTPGTAGTGSVQLNLDDGAAGQAVGEQPAAGLQSQVKEERARQAAAASAVLQGLHVFGRSPAAGMVASNAAQTSHGLADTHKEADSESESSDSSSSAAQPEAASEKKVESVRLGTTPRDYAKGAGRGGVPRSPRPAAGHAGYSYGAEAAWDDSGSGSGSGSGAGRPVARVKGADVAALRPSDQTSPAYDSEAKSRASSSSSSSSSSESSSSSSSSSSSATGSGSGSASSSSASGSADAGTGPVRGAAVARGRQRPARGRSGAEDTSGDESDGKSPSSASEHKG